MRSDEDDPVDRFRAGWRRVLPDLDTTPMAVLGRIYRIAQLTAAPITAKLESFGLHRGEFDVLGTLLRAGPPHRLTPTELYRSLMISSGGLTDRLQRLADAGLVERVPAEEDGRSLLVQLTPAGRAKAEAAFRADMAFEAELLADLSVDDRRRLASLLGRLSRGVTRRLR